MKFSAKTLEDNAVELTIEVPAAELAKGEKKALKQITEKINIHGFRKGKAPKDLVERQVGKEYILQSAFDLVYPKAVKEALDEGNYDPVTQISVEHVTLESGKDLVFTASFTDHPKVTLGEYKGMDIKRPEVNVTDEDVDKGIDNILYSESDLADAKDDEVTAEWDLVTIDFEGFVNGESFEGGKAEDYIIELGNGEFIDGFEEQLIGLKAGDEKEVNVTFPEDYGNEELAGKPAVFKCRVKSFKKRHYPELNDELAQKADKTAKTVDDLKAHIRERLLANANRDADNKWINAAVEQAADNITVDIPEIMIEDELDMMMKALQLRLKEQNIDPDAYFGAIDTDAGQYREAQRSQAEKNVRLNLMLEEVAKVENIEVTSQDLSAEIIVMAMAYNVTPNEVADVIKKQGEPARRNLHLTALRKKVAQFIFHSLPGNESPSNEQNTDDGAARTE